MIRPSSLFGKLFLGTATMIVLVLGICTWLIVWQVDQFYLGVLTDNLKTQAALIKHTVQDRFDKNHADELNRLIRELMQSQRSLMRVTFVFADGTVLADSDEEPSKMEPHGSRLEIQKALADGWGEDTHYSRTVLREMKYVAVRIGPDDAPVGVVRVATPTQSIREHSGAINRLIWLIAILGVVAAGVFAMGLAHLWSKPLRHITAIARSLSHGDLSARAHLEGGDELALLARSLNEMRDHLAEQMDTIDRQRRTLESLLDQLHEGVVVIRPDRRVLLMNPAAAGILGIQTDSRESSDDWTGLSVEQCVRHYELQRLLLDDSELEVREARIHIEREAVNRTVLARVSNLNLPEFNDRIVPGLSVPAGHKGRLLVLTDVTELTQAAQVKMDFATNASHELRTPLSTIRAAIETLLNLDLIQDANTVKQLVGMIDRQSGRMEEMVSDLLDLSKIESSPASRFKADILELDPLLEDVRARHAEKLECKHLAWSVEKPPEMRAVVANAELLRIVLDNLIDNSIKFTESDGRITIRCCYENAVNGSPSTIAITVADTGCGIPENEQQRVFERFYQVERARSGADRGTGLGLSIVRHAVSAMHGDVTLKSTVGQGTQVTIRLPQHHA